MAIFRHTDDLPSEARGAVVAIGNFDGVHRGQVRVVPRRHDEDHAERLAAHEPREPVAGLRRDVGERLGRDGERLKDVAADATSARPGDGAGSHFAAPI